MREPVTPKSGLYRFGGAVLLLISALVNPISVGWLVGGGYILLGENGIHFQNDLVWNIPLSLDVLLLVSAGLVFFHPKSLLSFLNGTAWFNGVVVICLFSLVLSSNVFYPGKWIFLRIALILLLIFFLSNLLFLLFLKPDETSSIQGKFKNGGISIFATIVTFLLLEIGFMFVARPHRYNGTLASRSWFLKYWEVNEMHYRDRSLSDPELAKRKKLFVLGDSFAAGHGLEDPEDRFSNLLGKRLLPMGWEVFNLGALGADTRQEFINLKEYPLKPDVLVYSWYVNDIQPAAVESGLPQPGSDPYQGLIPPFGYLIQRSYLLNYLWWNFPHSDGPVSYLDWLKQAYGNPEALASHERDLGALVDYANQDSIPLMVVIFPLLENVEGSGFAVDPVKSYFHSREVPLIDVGPLLTGKPVDKLVVNNNDSHPSGWVHAVVADALYQELKARGWIPQQPL